MELPIQESVLRDIYHRRNIVPTEDQLNILIQFIGRKLKRVIDWAVQFTLHSGFSTLREDHVFEAFRTNHVNVSAEIIQTCTVKYYIPASVFGRMVRMFGNDAATTFAHYPHAILNKNIRYSKNAMSCLQRYIEWLIDNEFPFTSS